MSKYAVLVGAAPIGKEIEKLKEILEEKEEHQEVYKVAVDGGIQIYHTLSIIPDFYIGDMDSSKEKGNPNQEILKTKVVPVIKDDTDMALALQDAYEKGYKEAYLFGGLGGNRFSHSIANIQLMDFYAKKGMRLHMIEEHSELTVIHNETIPFAKEKEGYISVFSLSEEARDVSIKGLFYEFEGNLKNDVALGVSNQFVGKEAVISVKEGSLLLICEEK